MPQLKRAIALGFFDGIHIGHAALLARILEISSTDGLTPAVMTFDTLPQSFLGKNTIPLINSPEDRVGLIRRIYNIDEVIFLHFNNVIASMPWSDFVDRLVSEYGAKHLVVGQNFRFGSGAAGNCTLLKQRCDDSGVGCDIIPDVKYDSITSSSTYIRELLLAGNVERANAFLGHPHVLTGIVRSGQQLGSSLGAPTLNMRFAPDVLVPAFGVYATKVYIEGDMDSSFPHTAGKWGAAIPDGVTGVTNIGVRPTVDNSGLVTAETHIPSFSQNLYGCKVRIEFYKYLRPEIKFDKMDALKEQIGRDCTAAVEYFKAFLS